MVDDLTHLLAQSLEVDPALLPILPRLRADLDALGTSVPAVLALLRPLVLQPGTRAVDLGCR